MISLVWESITRYTQEFGESQIVSGAPSELGTDGERVA